MSQAFSPRRFTMIRQATTARISPPYHTPAERRVVRIALGCER